MADDASEDCACVAVVANQRGREGEEEEEEEGVKRRR